MKVGLNIPTTLRIAPDLLAEIANFGYDVVRTDVPPTGDLQDYVSDYATSSMTPLFLLHDMARNQPLLDAAIPQLGNRFMVQIFGEQAFDHYDLSGYIDAIRRVHADCRTRGFAGQILMGGLANPGPENRAFIQAALRQMPDDLVVDEHRYAYKTQDEWARPWPPFDDRDEESGSLIVMADGRECAVTETSWHTAEEDIGMFRHSRLTDEQCRDNFVRDLDHYERAGYSLVCWFQINDGPNDTWGERQGIRRVDGTWKPQSTAVRFWKDAGGH